MNYKDFDLFFVRTVKESSGTDDLVMMDRMI
jgi:hypothetical protein